MIDVKTNAGVSTVGAILTGLGYAESVSQVFNVIYLVLCIVTSLVSLVSMGWILYSKIKEKYDKAKSDGVITEDEIKDIAKTATDGIAEIKAEAEADEEKIKGEKNE